MAKKYLSIEEAAALLNVNTTELNRLREKGMIRAFADRGTWKFKEEDVEKLARTREADSSPDVPLLASSDSSSSEMVIDDEDVLADQPTIIRKSPGEDSSDSDVRLIFDDDMNVAGTAVPPLLDDSDSDVKLAAGPRGSADDSDSDVKLAATPGTSADDSDSDVKLAGSKEGTFDMGSDSDVKLVMDDLPLKDTSGSDSDVRLVSSDSSGEVKLGGSASSGDSIPIVSGDDSSIGEVTESSSVIEDDSGISLGEGSGIALASDSGISLEQPNDSGISLSEESSLVLGSDSGISLAGDMPLKGDSGISLAQPASDKTKKKPGKGKTQPDAEDLSGTVPLMDIPLSEEEDLLDTHMEVPNLDDSQGSGDLFGDEGETANVVTLDDEDEEGYDVTANIPTQGGAALEDDEEEFVATDDEEPVEVADDLVGEDDELAEDVFGAEDDDFADEVESGESHSELPIAPRGMVAAAEQDWGMAMHLLLVASTVTAVCCGVVLFDMVRNMWHTDAANHNPIASLLLDMFKNI